MVINFLIKMYPSVTSFIISLMLSCFLLFSFDSKYLILNIVMGQHFTKLQFEIIAYSSTFKNTMQVIMHMAYLFVFATR